MLAIWQMINRRIVKQHRYFLLLFFTVIALHGFGQTEFDSLKRNSMLDTTYQPSNKPTFSTEFADVKISGFVQPALYFDNNNLLNNDLFVTSEIPTTDLTDVKFRRFHLSANQSRLGFSFNFPKAKKKTTAFLEGDFLSSTKGDNAYFRLRNAYVTYGELLVGQTWTNFGDISSSPNTLDLEGPNSATGSRVPQIRWRRQFSKKWNFLAAIEEPKADYTPLDSAAVTKAAFPEIVLKSKMTFRKGHWVNSVIYKPIIYTDKDYSFKKRQAAWGVSSSLTLNLPDGQAWFGITKKTLNVFGIMGAGTQGSINDFAGLGYEAFPKDSVTLQSLLYSGGYVAYSFVFKKRWSSTSVASYLYQQSPGSTDEIFRQSVYLSTNAIFAINKYFTVGSEFLFGSKENYDNSHGSAFRILCIMRLLF